MGQEALAQSATLMVSETYPAHATPMNNEDGAVDELEKMFKKAEGQNQDTSIDNDFSSKDHDADLIIDDQNPDDQFEDDLAKVTWMQKSSGSHQAEHIHASKSASIDARPISAPLERSSIWGVEMDSATAGGNNDGKNETHSIFGESTLSAVATQGGIAHGKYFVNQIISYVHRLAPVHVYPGEDEMKALAMNGYRILRGETEELVYS